MDLQPAVSELLGRLAPDQRASATARPGPVLCIAPAGSGKTTTIIARIAWLIDSGVDPATIAAITFNRRAASELAERLAEALEPLNPGAASVRIQTFHALGLEIVRDAGGRVGTLADRVALLGQLLPRASPAEVAALDTEISRLKVNHGLSAADVAADPEPGPFGRLFLEYQGYLAANGALDFDDLILGALGALDADPACLARWRRACGHLLVDEVQDLDRAQLRLALLLAAPANRLFLVGDDDQSIYGWRLADVRRVLTLEDELAGLRQVALTTNYRCPRPVVVRATRLISHNRERFAKTIRAGPGAAGRLVLAPDGSDDDDRIRRAVASWPDDGGSRAVLARTNQELLPAAAVAVDQGIAFQAAQLELPLDDPAVGGLLAALDGAAQAQPDTPPLVLLARLRGTSGTDAPVFRAMLGWAPRFLDGATFASAIRDHQARAATLRQGQAQLTLATAHGTKGLEFDHVIVLQDADRFPSRRALDEAADPVRALEEERRLAYVAWTRARRSLTLLYDPATPSIFLREAFSPAELSPGR
ncbi:MAG TPA: ATP-dependent helicase [Candidatus Limnocylindrales bacterium]